MKTFLALVLLLTVACGVEIGNCSDEPTPCECEECLKRVYEPANDEGGTLPEEIIEEVPPYDTEVDNG